MGGVNCCNRKEDENGKMTMFYQSRENQILDYTSLKVRAKNEQNLEETNLVENVENVENGTQLSAIRDTDPYAKKVRLIQSWFQGVKFRIFFKRKIKDLLVKETEDFSKNLEEMLLSVFEKNLSNFARNDVDSSEVYFEKIGDSLKPVKVFKAVIASYEMNNVCSFYKGEVNIKGQKHGFGSLYLKNNSYYQGFWVKGSFSSFGRFVDESGVLYEGKFVNGKLNGQGMKVFEGGVKKGNFVEGLLEGYGVEDRSDLSYEGNFVKDLKSGKGKYLFKLLNETYEGESTDDSITGCGLYVWENKDNYEGGFQNGNMHGKGKYKWPDGAEYEADYVDNIKLGKGKFKWSNGKLYEGDFANGVPNGVGIITYLNGLKFDVVFKDGKPVSKTPIEKA